MLEKSVPLFAMPTSPHVPYLTPHRRDFFYFFFLFFVGTGHIRLIKVTCRQCLRPCLLCHVSAVIQ